MFTSELTPFKMFMGFLCYSFFLAFHVFGHFCLSFCRVVSAEVFFSLLRASCKTFIELNAFLLCTWLFSSHFILFCFVRTCVPQLKLSLAVLVPPLFHLIWMHLLPSVFLSSILKGKLLRCLINSLYLARAIFTSFPGQGVCRKPQLANDYQVMTTWSYWQLLSNEKNLAYVKTQVENWANSMMG